MCCLCVGKGCQRRKERANGISCASRLLVLLLARLLMKLSSLPIRHAQRIYTSFCLVITNQQSPASGDFVAKCSNVRLPDPFLSAQYKRRKWSGYARLLNCAIYINHQHIYLQYNISNVQSYSTLAQLKKVFAVTWNGLTCKCTNYCCNTNTLKPVE